MSRPNGFFSPYSLGTPYWIIASGPNAVALSDVGGKPLYHNAELYGVMVASPWVNAWRQLADGHLDELREPGMEVAVLSSELMPSMQEIELSLRSAEEIHAVASSLWLADYLNDGRLICFMQRVVDRNDKDVGYEAFARMEALDGSIIGGGAIMQASHALHVEYQVDRMMHKQAVAHFVEAELQGLLFINFLTGFIHRPEVYLDGLSQAVEKLHMQPGNIVLDIPLEDYARDVAKLESIANYCRVRGFQIALDDVRSAKVLSAVIHVVRPAFVKLDAKLGHAVTDAAKARPVYEIIELSHGSGAAVLAEGVENEALRQAYLAADVDMFQGYYFGAPERAEAPRKKKAR